MGLSANIKRSEGGVTGGSRYFVWPSIEGKKSYSIIFYQNLSIFLYSIRGS